MAITSTWGASKPVVRTDTFTRERGEVVKSDRNIDFDCNGEEPILNHVTQWQLKYALLEVALLFGLPFSRLRVLVDPSQPQPIRSRSETEHTQDRVLLIQLLDHFLVLGIVIARDPVTFVDHQEREIFEKLVRSPSDRLNAPEDRFLIPIFFPKTRREDPGRSLYMVGFLAMKPLSQSLA